MICCNVIMVLVKRTIFSSFFSSEFCMRKTGAAKKNKKHLRFRNSLKISRKDEAVGKTSDGCLRLYARTCVALIADVEGDHCKLHE